MGTDALIALALDDPAAAVAAAREQLALDDLDAADESLVRQALGIAHRQLMNFDDAVREIEAALRLAARSGSEARLGDVHATLGGTMVMAGRAPEGLRHLDTAVGHLPRDPLVRMRRGFALTYLNRIAEAEADLVLAVEGFRAAGDTLWEARALHNLGFLDRRRGALAAAETHTTESLHLLETLGMEVEALWARQNLGEIRRAMGDLPRAIEQLDAVADALARLGRPRASLDLVRCRTYLVAGMPDEAVILGRRALEQPMEPHDRALLQHVVASALLDAGRAAEAVDVAAAARDGLDRFGDDWFAMRARLVLARAQVAAGVEVGAAELLTVARALDVQGAEEAPFALVLAADHATGQRRLELLDRAGRYRRAPSALTRAGGWRASAVAASARGATGVSLRACARGLDALDEHRETLGSTELRALATSHGRELASLALRHAVRHPRSLLQWSERWRATALAQSPVTPGDEPVLESLAALRDNGRRLVEARASGDPTGDIEAERARLERAVRAEHHRQAGRGVTTERFDVRRLVDEVGDGCLVELVDVDGVLHVLVVHGGRVRRKVAGTTEAALALTQSAAFLLRRAARGRPFVPGDLGQRLQDELLGDAARLIPPGLVTVAPTARLHGVPWALLPVLADRPFGIVPSAGQWMRARAVPGPTDPRLVLVTGPGLGSGGAEVPVLARRHPDAIDLTGPDCTVEAAMHALDGAGLAHVAAHGRFRADSPLFSSLEMADGPLTVHDLERLAVAPYRVVLSACESGVLAPVGADELLGLASALFALGTAGLVSSVAEVNDEATAELMVDLHDHLDTGADPATALHAVRRARAGDATAVSFVALGV